ncbi:MAG TPA: HAMP domain-containing sensor histidine kinase [Sphingomonas sp.]|jgi:signal transduction histidine kinase|uniref:sensor histidine kinase n=1 Tax=Sphingomonas sp. TaxID=28214 RepID=UPI002ED78BD9
MTDTGSTQAPIHGLVDADGRLVTADAALADLNARAGGAVGGLLAIPQLAGLVRLVRRLGIVVSRGVYTADGDRDLDLWVRASPQGDAVALAIVGWTETVSRMPFKAPYGDPAGDFRRSAVDWRWETDRHLRLTRLDPPHAAMVGQPLTRLFALQPGTAGTLPLIEAMGERAAFDHQDAWLEADPGRPVRLAARARVDADGGFDGFAGTASLVDPVRVNAVAAPADPAFGERLGAALRGPIDRIIANADRMRTGGADLRPDYVDYAGDIASAGRHLLSLVDDLIDLQAIERGDFRARDEAIDVADVARRASGLLAVRAGRTGVRIDAPDAETVLAARGEFGRALQILVNLISNAVRYSPEGGTVWIRGERDSRDVRIVVADQGKGIAPEDQERVFEKFERVDPNEPGGTGLGLYISRRLARAMGGDILLDSRPGDGARFMLVLPAE